MSKELSNRDVARIAASMLEQIENKQTGYKVRGIINGNFHLLKKDLETRATKEDVDKLKLRYYETEAALKADQPSPNIGERALVGVPYPGTVWGCKTKGVWYNTGVAPTPEELNLADYAKVKQIDVFNVTAQVPLESGYYTATTAKSAVPNSLRKPGLIITYQVSDTEWETEQFEHIVLSEFNWNYLDYWRNAKKLIINSPEWLVDYNRSLRMSALSSFDYAYRAIKDIWFEFPEGTPNELPLFWKTRTPMLRSVANDMSSSSKLKINFHDLEATEWDAAYDFDFSIDKWVDNELSYIETSKIIEGTVVKILAIVDGNILNQYSATNGLIITSANGLLLSAKIGKRLNSLFDFKIKSSTENDAVSDVTYLDISNQRKAIFQPRYIDVLPYLCSSNVTKSKIGLFIPTAKTLTTLTFSANDALDLDIEPMPLALKLSDTDYRIGYFSKAINNTITLIHSFGILDLNNVISCMAIHDTIRGGQGQHLSPWGYRAFAQYVVDKLNDTSCLADNLLKSYLTERCQLATDYKDKRIVDVNGNVLCEPIVNPSWKTGGNTGIAGIETGATIVNDCGIGRNSNNRFGFNWNTQAYSIVQGTAGAYVDFPINAEFGFKGFLKIGVVNPIQGDYDGKARMIVFSDKEEIYNEYISPFMDNVIVKLQDKFYKNLTVRFLITEDKNTKVVFNYIALYREYTNKLFPITDKSVVAILGSSNTQYPLPNAPYIDIIEGDADNEVITRPDGSIGDGYGYYPKHIARLTGATVDNWGMNGQTTFWGVDQLDEIFATKKYTHIIFTLFGNDLNGGIEKDVIIDNILRMCNYAIAQGCRPYVIMSYGTASSTQTYNYGRLHDMLIEGMY